ncbi:3-oxoadipate enol-lactonase [Paramyrothecium foliicola]|nr:3-oxoadipate enol-lactonase [Paramyrothecium foliicola]
MSGPGILYVSMQPKPGLSLDQFHEWYNNEHGPTRLRLPQIFSNGLRYQAADGREPTFLAMYDVTSMSHLETDTYTSLRKYRSKREAETIAQVDVKRYFYDLLHTHKSSSFKPIEALADEDAEGMLLVADELVLKEEGGAAQDFEAWFTGEHAKFMEDAVDCQRSRLFRTSSLENDKAITYLALYDFAKDSANLSKILGKGSMASPDEVELFDKHLKSDHIASSSRRVHSLFYVFGPAPRELNALSKLPSNAAFTSANSDTVTTPGSDAVIRSYVTTADALTIPYRLEGSVAAGAPTVAFCNSLLTSLHMWDPLIKILKRERPDLRILRYDTRGRHAVPQPPVAATLDRVAEDLAALLDALRITKVDAVVGVSMGGATALNFALRFPERLGKFIACDFNAASSSANTDAWKERIAVAEEDNGEGIKKLAGLTVARWFHPATMDKPDVSQWMWDMIAQNDVEGFKFSCTALWDYDLKPKLKGCSVPGLLAVGDCDGKGALPKAMAGFQEMIGEDGAELKIVPNTGHLPMCEDPQAFWDAIKDFL